MTFSHERVITICCKPGVIVNKYCQCILIVFLNKSKNQNPFEFTVAEATLFRFKKNIKNTCGSLHFYYYRNIFLKEWKYKMKAKQTEEQMARFADMFAAMGTEARLRIMRLLLSAHPQGMIVGDIQAELRIPNSTLSHHLEKLRNEGLVKVRRHGPFLWHTANTDALQEILNFLYAECCTRNQAVKPEKNPNTGNAILK
jgi:DNA-binding transcriptional ArsR family regulator